MIPVFQTPAAEIRNASLVRKPTLRLVAAKRDILETHIRNAWPTRANRVLAGATPSVFTIGRQLGACVQKMQLEIHMWLAVQSLVNPEPTLVPQEFVAKEQNAPMSEEGQFVLVYPVDREIHTRIAFEKNAAPTMTVATKRLVTTTSALIPAQNHVELERNASSESILLSVDVRKEPQEMPSYIAENLHEPRSAPLVAPTRTAELRLATSPSAPANQHTLATPSPPATDNVSRTRLAAAHRNATGRRSNAWISASLRHHGHAGIEPSAPLRITRKSAPVP